MKLKIGKQYRFWWSPLSDKLRTRNMEVMDDMFEGAVLFTGIWHSIMISTFRINWALRDHHPLMRETL